MAEKLTKSQIKEKFANHEYPIQIVGRHLSITEPMKAYAIEKLKKMEKIGGRFIDAQIIMDVQKQMQEVEYIVHVNDHIIKVAGRSENMYASIDMAIEKLESKLTRYISRIQDHHVTGIKDIEMVVNVIERIGHLEDINDQIEEAELLAKEADLTPHKVVKTETKPLKTLNQEEAIMKMELSEDTFMVYRNEENLKLRVIYRRDDKNYGIIEIEK